MRSLFNRTYHVKSEQKASLISVYYFIRPMALSVIMLYLLEPYLPEVPVTSPSPCYLMQIYYVPILTSSLKLPAGSLHIMS